MDRVGGMEVVVQLRAVKWHSRLTLRPYVNNNVLKLRRQNHVYKLAILFW